MGVYMVEIGEVDCVYDGDVAEYLMCLSFILQRTTANKTSGAPSYSRWSSSQPHQVICPCQKGYKTQVDTCFLLKWICEGIWGCDLPALAQLGHAELRLLQGILRQTVRCSCCSWRGLYSCDSSNAVVPLWVVRDGYYGWIPLSFASCHLS